MAGVRSHRRASALNTGDVVAAILAKGEFVAGFAFFPDGPRPVDERTRDAYGLASFVAGL
jgi:hypothetical protein